MLISTSPTSQRYESALSHCMSQCPSHMCVECGRFNSQLAFLKEKIRFCCLILCAIQTIRHCPWRHLGILDNMSSFRFLASGCQMCSFIFFVFTTLDDCHVNLSNNAFFYFLGEREASAPIPHLQQSEQVRTTLTSILLF